MLLMASSSSLRGFSGLVPQRKVDPAQFHHGGLPPCWGWPGGRQCISWPMTQEERSLGAPGKTVISLSGRDRRKDGIFLPLDNTRSECDTWKIVPSWEREGATLLGGLRSSLSFSSWEAWSCPTTKLLVICRNRLPYHSNKCRSLSSPVYSRGRPNSWGQ